MPLQSSGPISISEIMAELGITPGTPVEISGTGTPGSNAVAGSLVGDATGLINKVAPHQISEWYNYANSTSFSVGSTAYGLAITGCEDMSIGSLKYIAAGGNTYPEVSDTIYNDGNLVTLFDGDDKWYKIIVEDTVIKVNASGVVTDKEDCSQTLSASLEFNTVDEDATTVDLTITSNTSWNVGSSQTWVSFSSASGSGNDTIVVTVDAHTGTGNRIATINVTYGLGTESPTLTQLDIQYQTISLGYDASSGSTACAATPSSLKSDTTSLSTATFLLNFFTEEPSVTGWYSDGVLRKYWNGSAFTSTEFC